jgi:hypothetical protein
MEEGCGCMKGFKQAGIVLKEFFPCCYNNETTNVTIRRSGENSHG